MELVKNLVTFDFHNTLATCDPWFYLEIQDLPLDVLSHIDPALLRDHAPEDVTARYRSLRQGVIASGREIDAVECVARIAAELNIEVDNASIEDGVHRLMRQSMEHVEPVPGAIEVVREISGRGIPVGVISSAVYHPFLEWTLENFGIAQDLAFVVTSASCGHYKSNPEIYRYAMSLVGSDPSRSIHVGDSPKWDVWAAQQAGMRAIWFSNGDMDTFVDRAPETTPDYTTNVLTEAAPWIYRYLDMPLT
jgi:HAD superfamily hydrolase (TIGR01509 family)